MNERKLPRIELNSSKREGTDSEREKSSWLHLLRSIALCDRGSVGGVSRSSFRPAGKCTCRSGVLLFSDLPQSALGRLRELGEIEVEFRLELRGNSTEWSGGRELPNHARPRSAQKRRPQHSLDAQHP
eukprot:456317-Rhodomonas_salina.1